ncbi:MAG TPA: ABC transporter ATP-binding protein [Candidatus Enterosoma merdigallinarum]|nr:ABC transporter ATP-binding protein [Candidatus Enterosoma merdigallinarum]
MKKTMVKISHVMKVFHVGDNVIKAVNDLSFDVEEGKFCIVLGPSGSGKTTALNLIGGMDKADEGELVIDGKNLLSFNDRQLCDYRRNDVGFVFQFYNLMPNLTAKENVELSTEMCRDAFSPEDILAKVGLQERMNNFPAQLSGGEQQRVSIARALAKNPKILLCDEPTGALDYQTGKTILKLLKDMSHDQGKTIIVVTHNSAIKDMADEVVHIKNGSVESIEMNEKPKDIEEIEW